MKQYTIPEVNFTLMTQEKSYPNSYPISTLLQADFLAKASQSQEQEKDSTIQGERCFFEIARIVAVKKPKYLFLENVPGLLNHDSGKTFETILNTLNTGSPKSIKLFGERRCSIACEFLTACGWKRVSTACTDEGYDVCCQVLNSKNFGVPQSRNRVFIIGYLRGQCAGEVLSFTQ